ncbi:MAG TPA: hypothetical protein VIJ14_06570, partial [Rhabdochlamydiaceae bacterium]
MNFKRIVLPLFLFTYLLQASEVWVDPSKGTINHLYVGAPGMVATAAQFTRLTPYLRAPTGEVIRCKRGITVVPPSIIVAHLAEISPRSSTRKEVRSCVRKAAICLPLCALGLYLKQKYVSDNGAFLPSVGLLGCLGYIFWRPINFLCSDISHKGYGFTFDPHGGNASIRQYAIDPFKINIAQEDDVRIYSETLEANLKRQASDKKTKAVLYGISRGSATVLETFAKLDSEGKSEDIGAVICEGIFDSVPNIMNHAPFMQKVKVGALLALGFSRFKKKGMSPLSMLTRIT